MVHGGRRGSAAPSSHIGSIRKRLGQPFPDLPMCLSCVWYLTDVDARSGGTWVVPGSFRDTRNPFGPEDGIVRSAPIPGELQISAAAGSIFMQDTRTWHSSPMWNPSGADRVAMVVRYVPWWITTSFSSGMGSMTKVEYEALPASLQPLVRHCVAGIADEIQPEKQQQTVPYGENAALELERGDDANEKQFADRPVVIPSMYKPRL